MDVGDLGILAAHYGVMGGATWSQGDFNGDGRVDVGDLGILAAHYGQGPAGGHDEASAGLLVNAEENADESPRAVEGCYEFGFLCMSGMAFMGMFFRSGEE